ncbi:MAG: UDP-4-amino-4,6-dideoxy-N-acetyl-beta-L-altrosamine transaminase [Nitrospirae bacterium]|nr:UDP-4-amino-4,6-dideoxy-N-acetyl-beta-L-altrosamine transaminase [Nitrospirota bacterium]MCL5237994.1 UDP-4-amino-4,6-dideoxy-N-acetyl-beta-L-altrosamine transaminase [Nitrospirota bacterium]
MTDFFPYSRQAIDEEDIAAVVSVLKSDYLTQGPAVEAFEKALSEYAGACYAVVFSSGTAALHAAYFAAGLGQADEMITSPITFAATSNAALMLGIKPVFVDVEGDTGNIDLGLAGPAVKPKTKAVVPVHYAGHPADMDGIRDIARKHGLIVIEDACHAIGAQYSGRKIGGLSDITVFSFHPVKPITTGEGGAALTNDRGIYRRLKQFRTHGITREDFVNESHGDWYYEMQFLGNNYRMTDIQAALGTSQLKKLDAFTRRRRYIAERYSLAFKDNPYFDLPPERGYAYSSYHLYPVRLKDGYKDKRRAIFTQMRKAGLGVQVHYIPVYLQPYYQKLGYERGLCPIAEDFYQREISIPIYPAMGDGEINSVVTRIFEVFKHL